MYGQLQRHVSALEKKIYMQKYREKNKDRIKEKAQAYRQTKYNAVRREKYKNNPEKIMRERLNSAANLLYKHGLIDEMLYSEIRGRVNNG